MSVGQEVVHDEAAAAPTVGMPRAGERLSVEELVSRFGVGAQGDVRINHAGKCIVLVDRTNGKPNRGNGDGGCMTFLRTAMASYDRAGRDGGLFGDNLLLSRSREEGYTVLYFRKVRNMLEFASRVEYDSHAFRDKECGGGVMFKMRAVSDGASDTVLGAPSGRAQPRAMLDSDMVERVERVISANHPYDSKDRLLGVLPSHVSAADLDRVLDHLKRSRKITMHEGVIRWTSKSARSDSTESGKHDGGSVGTANKSILAGTRFEVIEEGKNPTETTGEYIVRLVNSDEPGTYTAEDAKEIDEDMRSLAKGEYYTHEQVRKEFGL